MSNANLEDLESELSTVSKQIEETRQHRDELNAATSELIKLIKATSNQIKDHLKKATTFREKRDEFNENVQAAKNHRITTQIALEELRKRLAEIKEKHKEIEPLDRQKQAQISKLRKAVHARNMEIETKPNLTTDDEDRLIKEIEEMELKLGELTKGTEARKEYSKVIAQFPLYKSHLKKYHDEVIENSEESQKFHELMLKEYEQVDALREKIGVLEKELNENRKTADTEHQKLLGLYKRRDVLRDTLFSTQREVRTQRRRERGNPAIMKRRLAKERVERGERIDFIEFRLLLEKNDIPGLQE